MHSCGTASCDSRAVSCRTYCIQNHNLPAQTYGSGIAPQDRNRSLASTCRLSTGHDSTQHLTSMIWSGLGLPPPYLSLSPRSSINCTHPNPNRNDIPRAPLAREVARSQPRKCGGGIFSRRSRGSTPDKCDPREFYCSSYFHCHAQGRRLPASSTPSIQKIFCLARDGTCAICNSEDT